MLFGDLMIVFLALFAHLFDVGKVDGFVFVFLLGPVAGVSRALVGILVWVLVLFFAHDEKFVTKSTHVKLEFSSLDSR